MNELDDSNETPIMVHNFRFKHDHYGEGNPLVIFKITEGIANHQENVKKWYGLVKYITEFITDEIIDCDDISNWVFIYNVDERPNGHDSCYMKEFLYDHYIHIVCYMHTDPRIHLNFNLFTDNPVSRLHLLKHDKDFDSWESVANVENVIHGEE